MKPNAMWMTATLLAAATPLSAIANDLRVNPYLQSPSSDGMYFTWFTESATPGLLSITGGGLSSPLQFNSTPMAQPLLAYTNAEKTQNIGGLVQGSWLLGDMPHKHAVDVRGLQPGTTYGYTLTQGGQTFSSTFATAPVRNDWSSIRFIALSDSETDPAGRVSRREWQPGALAPTSLARPALSGSQWATSFGTSGSGVNQVLRYALTETEGYRRNLAIVDSRNPNFIVMPGDLVQGGGYQPGWDEFFRHNAGEYDDVLSKRPILPALGNWENFAAINGGYGTDADGRFGPKFARDKYHVYFDAPGNGTEAHADNYYRIDYGPVTVITLDSSKGVPEDFRTNYPVAERLTGQQYTGPGTDTQSSFTVADYEAAGGTDLSPYNPGTAQWNWAQAQLSDARAAGQIVFVQWHHAPFSDGEHGLPMNHVNSSGQGGTPMRVYHDMLEQYGVAAVFSGHSEMFERSFVDNDGDGFGVMYYDVGVAGDGLRGERRNGNGFDAPLLDYNPFSQWSADQSAPEHWALVDGVLQLVDGGKHYGHLEVNIERLEGNDSFYAKVTFTPVYSFPLLDSNYQLLDTERRVYGDEITLFVNAAGQVVAVPEPQTWAMIAGGLGLVGFTAARRRRV
jgi:hypothetical protein